MKSLEELKVNECKFALTTSASADFRWNHLRLGDTKGVVTEDGKISGGGAFKHGFCGAPTHEGEPYCAAHKARCYRGPGKDVRSLEEMMYATDQSQYRGRQNYADHTDPVDREIKVEVAA